MAVGTGFITAMPLKVPSRNGLENRVYDTRRILYVPDHCLGDHCADRCTALPAIDFESDDANVARAVEPNTEKPVDDNSAGVSTMRRLMQGGVEMNERLRGAGLALLGVALVACESNATNPEAAKPAGGPTPADVQVGEAKFGANCAGCHGVRGVGTKQGPPLVHKIYEPNHHADVACPRRRHCAGLGAGHDLRRIRSARTSVCGRGSLPSRAG